MTRKGVLILAGTLLAGLLFVVFVWGLAQSSAPAAPRPPELAGQQVPNAVHEIRFDRTYDLYCTFFRDEPTTYRGCKILGFTGRGGQKSVQASAPEFVGFSNPSGSGSAYGSGRYFEQWLVLELADGRKSFIPPGSVRYIEEASPETK